MSRSRQTATQEGGVLVQFELLAQALRRYDVGELGDIAAGPRETGDYALTDGIAAGGSRHDRYDRCRGAGSVQGSRTCNDNRYDRKAHQLGSKSRQALEPTVCVPLLDDQVAPLAMAECGEAAH